MAKQLAEFLCSPKYICLCVKECYSCMSILLLMADFVENMKIVHLGELVLTQEHIGHLSDEEVSFIATLCFAVDEISVFERLLVQTMNGLPRSEEMLQLHTMQQLTIMRVMNAKVLEALKIFNQYKTMLERSGKKRQLDFLRQYNEEVEKIRTHPAFETAQEIRNTSTNHYTPSETKKNLKFHTKNQDLKMYFHENNGNSFHPIGEDLVFIAKLAREMGSREKVADGLDGWIGWGLKASKFLKKAQQEYLIWLATESVPNWRLTKKTPYLEAKFSGVLGETTLPLYLDEKKNK